MVKYDSRSLVTGLLVGALAVGGVTLGKNFLENRFPAKMAHYFGNERVQCVDTHPDTIDLSDLTRGDILAQSIMTTPDTSRPFVGGFFYLTPNDTTSIKNGYPIFVEDQAHSTICETINSNGIIRASAGDEGEGGYVTRIDLGLPPAEALGKYFEGKSTPEISEYKTLLDKGRIPENQKERLERIQNLYEASAIRLKNLDVNYVLGPPLDIVADTESDENIMSKHDRSYGSNPDTIIQLASLYIDAMHSQDIKVIGKHYLGVGMSSTDPHKAGTAITIRDRELLERPFASLTNQLDGMMVSHLATSDALIPDSLNPEVYRHLRQDLGFEGLLITDDMYMGAIEEHYDGKEGWIEQASLDALAAGADVIILKYSTEVGSVLSTLSREVERNAGLEISVRESFERILDFKGISFTDGSDKHPEIRISGGRSIEHTRSGQEEQWVRRRVKRGESLISIMAEEDPSVAGYNDRNQLAIRDNDKWIDINREFEERNGLRPTKMRAGDVYLFPDMNNDLIVAPNSNPEKIEVQTPLESNVESLPLRVNRGDTFYGFLAGELGCSGIVDGRTGNILPITRGILQPHYQSFKDENDGVDPRKIQARKKYQFPDINGDGVVEILDEGTCFR